MHFILFKKTIYYFCLIFCIPIVCYFVLYLSKNTIILPIELVVMIISFLILAFLISEILAIRSYGKLRCYFYQDCDPLKFINEAEKLYKKNVRSKIKLKIGNDLIYSYISLGEYSKALEMLDSYKDIRVQLLERTDFDLNLLCGKFQIFVSMKDYNNALECYNEIKKIIADFTDEISNFNTFKETLLYMENRLSYLNNDLENLDELIKEVGVKQENNFSKVSSMLFLAEIYLKKDDKKMAKRYLEDVISLGNKTIYVQRAQAMLAENF